MKRFWVLPYLGVIAAGVLLVNVNVLSARWYKRWDLTSDRLYTLSGPTRELLASLDKPVDVTVLLSNSDPLTLSVRHMLEAYGAETRRLRVRYVDPDRSPASVERVLVAIRDLLTKRPSLRVGQAISNAMHLDGRDLLAVENDELVSVIQNHP